MNIKILAIFLSVLVVNAGLASCSRGRTDAQITTDVQQRILAEAALNSEPIRVQANNGRTSLTAICPSAL
jgi:osmotically-inducible protein OsmY